MQKNVNLIPFAVHLDRCGNYLFNSPPESNPCSKGLRSCTESDCPLDDAESFIVMGKQSIISPISTLFFWCCPSNVVWLIVTIFIGIAVNGVFESRTFSYVGNEHHKIVPPITYCNSTTPVVLITTRVWVVTSAFHLRPDSVKWVLLSVVTQPMCTGTRYLFPVETPTTCGTFGSQSARVNNPFSTTPTGAVVVGDSALGMRVGVDYPATERFAGQVFKIRASFHTPVVTGEHNQG